MEMIWICVAEHHTVPGILTSAHRTKEGADKRAAELAQIMVDDSASLEWTAPVTADNWEACVEALQDLHGAAHVTVEVFETKLEVD